MKKHRNRAIIGGLALLCLLAAACGDRADRTYRQGLRLARQKKFDQAVGEMRRLIQMDPENSRARNALGQIYRAQNLYTRAIEELKTAVEMSRSDPSPAYNLGCLYWELEDFAQAENYYLQALEIDPSFSPALYRMGAAAARRSEFAAAERYYRAFLESDPDRPAPGYNNLGVLFWRRGERTQAFSQFEKAIKTGGRYPEVLYNFGVTALLLEQQTRRGAEAIQEYLQADPRAGERMELKSLLEGSGLFSVTAAGLFSRDDYLRQGEAYEAAGQYNLAEKEYRQALQLDPASPDVHYRLGEIYDRFLSDGVRAVPHYEKFLQARPRSPAAGKVIARLRELRPVLVPATVPVRSTPRTPASAPRFSPTPAAAPSPGAEEYCRQAERLAADGAFDRAAAAYRRCLEISPDDSAAHLGLGRALLSVADYAGAVAGFLRARELDPAAPVRGPLGRAYILLGAGAQAAGHFEEAVEYFQNARREGMEAEADEGLWKTYHTHFRRLQERGDWTAAAEQLEKCLQLKPQVEEDYIELADLYRERLNNPAAARRYYQKYLELSPRGKYADRAQEYIRPAPPPRSAVPRQSAVPPPPPVRSLSATEHYNRGAVYQREGRGREAREEYLKAVALRPDFYQAFYNLGILENQSGRQDQALAAFKQTARLKPDFAPAQLSLFTLYYHHYGMKNLARPYALRYIELAPETPQARELRRGLGL